MSGNWNGSRLRLRNRPKSLQARLCECSIQCCSESLHRTSSSILTKELFLNNPCDEILADGECCFSRFFPMQDCLYK